MAFEKMAATDWRRGLWQFAVQTALTPTILPQAGEESHYD
jgi:hypothetical protein